MAQTGLHTLIAFKNFKKPIKKGWFLYSFLLGSIPTGYLLVLLSGQGDIRKFGSKNIIVFSLINPLSSRLS